MEEKDGVSKAKMLLLIMKGGIFCFQLCASFVCSPVHVHVRQTATVWPLTNPAHYHCVPHLLRRRIPTVGLMAFPTPFDCGHSR